MTSDLETFLSEDGRVEAVEAVNRQIVDQGVEYMYYQFVSVTGRIMGKGIPAAHFKRIAGTGFQLVYGSTANLFTDRHGNYIGYGPEARELVGIAEPETFNVLPWDPKTARVWCTLFRGREEEVDGGAFLSSDCRGNLKRIHAKFTDDTGLHLRAGTEPEMMWLKVDADGKPTVEGKTKPYCYHIDQFSELQPLIHKVMEYGKAMDLDMIQGDHEDAPGQLELNFMFDHADKTADRLTTYRQICRQVGRELGAFACFMPKPFMGVSANGCHHNISLWEGDENKFMPEGDDPQMPGQIGLWAIGGIIKHLRALTCLSSPTVNSYRRLWDAGFWAPIFADWGFQNRTTGLRISAPGRFEYRSVDSAVNPYLSFAGLLLAMQDGIIKHLRALTCLSSPTVNSYRRLWDAGFWAPIFADWGFQNRTTGLRISAPGRFEYRSVDSAVNPYLSFAGLLLAMQDGIENKIDPGEPEERNIYEAIAGGKEVERIPTSLGEALDALEADDVVMGALPGDMGRVFMHYKRDEWERFLATVSDWDVEEYLDILP